MQRRLSSKGQVMLKARKLNGKNLDPFKKQQRDAYITFFNRKSLIINIKETKQI